jgi:hypothetical protein
VTWSTSSDVHAFLAAAGVFLEADPVAHTVLLTEAAYLAARPHAGDDQRYGWWRPAGGGPVEGALLQAPRHPPILSTMPAAALESLVDLLPDLPPIGVDGRLVDPAVAAWRRRGMELTERSRIRLHRLRDLRPPAPPAGRARVATRADRDRLVTWYERLMAAFPDDPSDLAYVVDDPIGYGGITLWEVDGTPTAMAGRSRLVAGMVRMGAVYAPEDPGDVQGLGQAALVAACAAARAVARDVLIFSGTADTGAADSYRSLGFEPVLDRVMLAL